MPANNDDMIEIKDEELLAEAALYAVNVKNCGQNRFMKLAKNEWRKAKERRTQLEIAFFKE